MKLFDLLKYLDYKRVLGRTDVLVERVESDSRKVKHNTLFVCIKGHTVDGHDFVRDVYLKGASVIVSEREDVDIDLNNTTLVLVSDTNRALAQIANAFYRFPSSEMNLIGVTGTNGKTTVSNIIYDLLGVLEAKAGVFGTIAVKYGDKEFKSKNTTHDILTTQKMLATMKEEGVKNVVMEVSSHGLSLGRTWGLDFDTAIFTNLSQDHLDFHETMEDYARAKGQLFSQLGNDYTKNKLAILNGDDEWFEFYKSITPARMISYGKESHNDYQILKIETKNGKTLFTFDSPKGVYDVEINFVGEFNVYNALAAIIALQNRGYELEKIVSSFGYIKPAEGRMEKIETEDGRNVYVDFAHTPDGIEKVLEGVKDSVDGKVIFLIGSGGNRDKTKRPIMAKVASENADFVILTSDNPREENPADILRDMEKGIVGQNYKIIENREEAIYEAIKMATPQDLVILAGKGHEKTQIIGKEVVPFSDSLIALEALKKFPLKK